jgi:hypothetical protein
MKKLIIVAAFLGLVQTHGALLAQTRGSPARFTAFAVNMGSPGRGGASTVDIVVDRWSTDADREKLMTALVEKGPEKLLDTLQDLPRVGYFRTPNSVGYDLHFARTTPLPEGGERIVLATDRYIGFWEAANRPRTIDYPFTLIEIRLNKDGEGEGKMSIATKVIYDKKDNMISLEDFQTSPVLLNNIKRQKVTH